MVKVGQEVDAQGHVVSVRAAAVVGRVKGEVQVLDAEREGEDEAGEDLAGAARGQPAVDPGKDHP